MTRSRAGTALLVAAFVAAGSFAQSPDELQKQLNELRAAMQAQARAHAHDVQRLEAENAELKSMIEPKETGLETEINRLSERMANATTVRSCASQITLGGEFRFRGYYMDMERLEFQGKGFEAETWDGTWADARVRLGFRYDFGCDVTAYAELQSHWAFGGSPEGTFYDWNFTRPDEVPASVGMYQAWLEFRRVLCRPELSVRIGRQEVVLGNQFQFGNADWYNGVSHDGVRVDWDSECWSLTGLALKLTTLDGDRNQVPSYFTDHDDDELLSLYFTLKSIKCTEIDVYWIYVNGHGGFAQNSGASYFVTPFLYPLSNAYYHTLGARIGGTFNVACGLDYNVEAAAQTGETHLTGFELDTDGYTGEAEVGLTFSKSSRFRVFARGLFASGGDDDGAGYLINFPNRHTYGGFRARYGLADLIPMSNVVSLQLGAHFDPHRDWTLGATGLWAQTDEPVFGGSDGDYGTELDLWAEYRYSPLITIGAGVALVFPDEAGETIWQTTDDMQFVAYLQARLMF